MISTVLASVALLATYALADEQPGYATVVNNCNYNVYLSNTPSMGSAIDQTLSPWGSYSQQYTKLDNLNGWSLKLSKVDGSFGTNILQYEYTYHPGEPIWYDLSEVDGNPWDGNWEITATGSCTPRQAAYRYSTDDAYGMQSCEASSSITVTLCSGTSGGSSEPPTSEPPASPSSPVESPAPTSVAPPAASNTWNTYTGFADKNVQVAASDVVDAKKLPKPTTLVTSSVDAWTGPAVTVTNLKYETVTQIVTATGHAKRHVHHPRHPHH